MSKRQEIKMVVNIGTKNGKTEKLILTENLQSSLYGMKIGDEFAGKLLGSGYAGYIFKITGGTDRSGFALRADFEGSLYYKPLLSTGVGYNPKKKGERKRKRIRGSEIQEDVTQLNCMVIKTGKKPLNQDS